MNPARLALEAPTLEALWELHSTESERSRQKLQAAGLIPAASHEAGNYRKSEGADVGGGLRREPMTGP